VSYIGTCHVSPVGGCLDTLITTNYTRWQAWCGVAELGLENVDLGTISLIMLLLRALKPGFER